MQIPLDKNTFISAGAGTGKTHILVERYIELLQKGYAEIPEIVAITFTEKAAKEMKDRIRERCSEKDKRELENSRIDTIHGLCARIIRENPIEIGIDPRSDILDETEELTLLDKLVHRFLIELLEEKDSATTRILKEYGLRDTKAIIRELVKNRMDIDKSIQADDIYNIYEKISKRYEDYKRKNALLDFDDLIIYVKKLLKENKAVRRYYQKLIKYILVDEYQDTDFHQKEIIFYLAEGRKNKLFIVGDMKQSIYRFRGADVSVFQNTKRALGKNCNFFDLNINMRSLPQIIDFINDLFGKVMGRNTAGKKDYESVYKDILPYRKDNSGTIEFLSIIPEEEDTIERIRSREADLIARKIIQLANDKVQFKDIAVLFRAMTDIKLYEDVFRKYNIPYYIIAGSGFYARQEIKDILNYLKALDDPNDKIAVAGVLRSPMVGLTDNGLYWWFRKNTMPKDNEDKTRLENYLSTYNYLKGIKDHVTISYLLQEIIRCTNYYAILAGQYMGEQRILNIFKLIDSSRRFESKGIFTFKDFTKYIDELVINEAREGEAAVSEEESNVVKVMTIHKAKGLEFPVVIIPDISRRPKSVRGPVLFDRNIKGLGLKVRDKDGEYEDTEIRKIIKEEIERKELAESKRLLYVASTRARDYIIYSGIFNQDNEGWSKWLGEYMDNPMVKVTTEISNVSPLTPTSPIKIGEGKKDLLLKQIEPVPAFQKTRLTPTETRFIGPRLAIETHKFFQRWDFSARDIPEEIKDLVMNFMKDPLYEEVRSAVEIKKEVPITYKDNGVIVDGIIDLLYKKKDGNWVILDYKTDKTTERIKEYEKQLMFYKSGVEKILGIKPEKAVIFFLRPGVAIRLP